MAFVTLVVIMIVVAVIVIVTIMAIVQMRGLALELHYTGYIICIVRIVSCGLYYVDSIVRIILCRLYYMHYTDCIV